MNEYNEESYGSCHVRHSDEMWNGIKNMAKRTSSLASCLRNIGKPTGSTDTCEPSTFYTKKMHADIVVKTFKRVTKAYRPIRKAFEKTEWPFGGQAPPSSKVAKIKWDRAEAAVEHAVTTGVSINNIYVWLHRILSEIAEMRPATLIVSFLSLHNLFKWYGYHFDSCSRDNIALILKTIESQSEWKLEGLADSFVSSRVFMPSSYVPERFLKWGHETSLHPHQTEFLTAFLKSTTDNIHVLAWTTGSGKSMIVPAILTSCEVTFGRPCIVIQITQPLLVRQAAALVLGANRGVGICDHPGTPMAVSPSCGMKRSKTGQISFENPPHIIVTTPDAFEGLMTTDPVFKALAVNCGEELVLVVDDLPMVEVRTVLDPPESVRDVLSKYNTYNVVMTATLKDDVVANWGSKCVVWEHFATYGFVDFAVGSMPGLSIIDGMVEKSSDAIKQWFAERPGAMKFLTPRLTKLLAPHFEENWALFNLRDLESPATYAAWLLTTIQNHLKPDLAWPTISDWTVDLGQMMREETTEPCMKDTKGTLLLTCEKQLSQLVGKWYDVLYKTGGTLDEDLKQEKKQMKRTVVDPESSQLVPRSLKRVGLKQFAKPYDYTTVNGKLTIDRLDASVSSHNLKVSGLGMLHPDERDGSMSVVEELRGGMVPFTILFTEHCNGHNLDASGVLLDVGDSTKTKDVTLQAIGRVGRFQQQSSGSIIPANLTTLKNVVAFL